MTKSQPRNYATNIQRNASHLDFSFKIDYILKPFTKEKLMVQRTVFRRRGNQTTLNSGPDFGDGANHFGRRRYRRYHPEPRVVTTPTDSPRTTIIPQKPEIEYVLPTSADDVTYVVLWLKDPLEELLFIEFVKHIKRRIFVLDKTKRLLLIENMTVKNFPRMNFPNRNSPLENSRRNRYNLFEYRTQELPFEIPPEPYTP